MLLDQRRVLRLAALRNLRDVGGYPTLDGRQTRWSTLYRSDCLDRLTPEGQASLLQIGLRSVIDIRDHTEVADRPNAFATSTQLAYRHLPFFEGPPPDDYAPDLREGYRRELDMLGSPLVALVEQLVRPGTLPTLVHCAAGKDRTGVAIAVILAAVRTDPRAIVEDYALSEACLGPTYLEETRAWVLSSGWDWSAWEHTVFTPPERMLKTLAYLDERHGGVERYLLDRGLSASSLPMLREALTEST